MQQILNEKCFDHFNSFFLLFWSKFYQFTWNQTLAFRCYLHGCYWNIFNSVLNIFDSFFWFNLLVLFSSLIFCKIFVRFVNNINDLIIQYLPCMTTECKINVCEIIEWDKIGWFKIWQKSLQSPNIVNYCSIVILRMKQIHRSCYFGQVVCGWSIGSINFSVGSFVFEIELTKNAVPYYL